MQQNKRNLTRQIVPVKDDTGNVIGNKNIFHTKKTNSPAFVDLKSIWRDWNKAPKPNSKRQQRLKEEAKEREERLQQESELLIKRA